MTHYEMLVVLPGTLTEIEAKPVIATIKETAEKYGATELSLHDMGKSRLAYPMKHIRYGYFYILQFTAAETDVQEVQARVRLIGNVLRLTLRTYDPATQTVNASTLSITPLSSVVNLDEVAPTARETVRDSRRETAKPVVAATEEVEVKAKDVSMEEIEEKLDQILEKDLTAV